MGDEERIRELLDRLDTPDFADHERLWQDLVPFGAKVAAEALSACRRFRNWQARTTLVLQMTRYGRVEEGAFQLGLATCRDVSPIVRHRACALLAYSLRDEAIPVLATLLNHKEKTVRESAAAAIDAIRCRNHHYFVDRTHSGTKRWDL